MSALHCQWLPRPAQYAKTWQAMRQFTQSRDPTTPDALWLVEHEPVYTLGQAGKPEHVLNPGAIPVVHCDRGGQVTYHGPGQVVLYTLVDLRRHAIHVRPFVTLLEDVVLDVLAENGIDSACRKPGAPGIYVPAGAAGQPQGDGLAKIAALGIKVHRGCAYHGVAVNVDMDLSPFTGINPCGFQGLRTVDMAACGVRADVQSVGQQLARRFSQVWEHNTTEAT